MRIAGQSVAGDTTPNSWMRRRINSSIVTHPVGGMHPVQIEDGCTEPGFRQSSGRDGGTIRREARRSCTPTGQGHSREGGPARATARVRGAPRVARRYVPEEKTPTEGPLAFDTGQTPKSLTPMLGGAGHPARFAASARASPPGQGLSGPGRDRNPCACPWQQIGARRDGVLLPSLCVLKKEPGARRSPAASFPRIHCGPAQGYLSRRPQRVTGTHALSRIAYGFDRATKERGEVLPQWTPPRRARV
jgi:hypothetical protein